MSLGAIIAAPLLRGLSWFLFALAAFISLIVLARLTGLQATAASITDALGAVICAVLASAARWLALRFERLP